MHTDLLPPREKPRGPLHCLWIIALILTLVASGCSDDTTQTGEPDTGVTPPPDVSIDTNSMLPDAGPEGDTGYKLDVPGPTPPDTTSADTEEPGDPDVITLEDGADTGDEVIETPVSLESLFPVDGPSSGRTTVQIFGEGFTPESEVYFGSQRAPDMTFIDDDELEVITPTNTSGTVSVKVINQNGTATLVDAFTYVDPITVTRVDPDRSPTRGGMPFAIEGAGFEGEVFVTVGNRSAVEVQVVSDTRLTGITPPNPEGVADVRVTSEVGSILAEDAITYYVQTRIDDIHPGAGASAGGDTVTITGAGFDSESVVTIGGAAATVVDQTATQLDVLTPAGVAGPANVRVFSNDNGSATVVGGYLYIDDPTDPTFDVIDVEPDHGPVAGGQVAVVRGTGFGSVNQVAIGGTIAPILDATDNSLRVEVPAGFGGQVADVVVTTGDPLTETLTGAYTYHAAFDTVAPNQGDAAGGESVVLTGRGFDAGARVFFGSIEATVTNVDGNTITVTTPPGAGGSVDVVVEQLGYEVRLADSFFYTAPLDVFAITPRRGARAGGTVVTITGKGFAPDAQVIVDDAPVDPARVTYINASTLVYRAPAHEPGIVEVKVTQGAEEEPSPDIYTYYDPGSQFGGGWGSDVSGTLNVTVLDGNTNQPIESAFVIVSADTSTTYQGATDALGQITFSDTDLSGVQSVSAMAEGYSSSTITSINAENLTFFLNEPSSSDGEPPPPPPTPDPSFIHGTITGINKVSLSDQTNLVKRAVIMTSETLNPDDPNPDPGEGGIVEGDEIVDGVGEFRIQSRLGTVAVIGMCGIYNTATDVFDPKFIAIERFVQVPPGVDIEVHLNCATAMNLRPVFKLVGAPVGAGTDINVVFPILEIGPEGFLTEPWAAQGTASSFQFNNMVPLTGPFEDMRYDIQALSVSTTANYPRSVIVAEDVTDFSAPLEMGPMMGVPQMITPRNGDTLLDTRVEWTIANPDTIDLYEIYIFDTGFPPSIVWDVYLPGDATGFDLPRRA